MKIDMEAMKKQVIDGWNREHPNSQFIDTSEFVLETETKKTKKVLLKEIYDLKIDNEMQKNKSYVEGFEKMQGLVYEDITKEKFIRISANLTLNKEEDCIVDKVDELIRYAMHHKNEYDKLKKQYIECFNMLTIVKDKIIGYKITLKDIIISEYEEQRLNTIWSTQ